MGRQYCAHGAPAEIGRQWLQSARNAPCSRCAMLIEQLQLLQLGFGPARFWLSSPGSQLGGLRLVFASIHHIGHWWTKSSASIWNVRQQNCKPGTLTAINAQGCNKAWTPFQDHAHLHISLDPFTPDLDIDIVAIGSATIQCKNISDCQAKEPPTERPQTLRALAFANNETFVSSLGVACMAQLRSQQVGRNGSTLSADTVALLKRYEHGNESDKYSVNIVGHWRQDPGLDGLLRGAFSIGHEGFASPLE